MPGLYRRRRQCQPSARGGWASRSAAGRRGRRRRSTGHPLARSERGAGGPPLSVRQPSVRWRSELSRSEPSGSDALRFGRQRCGGCESATWKSTSCGSAGCRSSNRTEDRGPGSSVHRTAGSSRDRNGRRPPATSPTDARGQRGSAEGSPTTWRRVGRPSRGPVRELADAPAHASQMPQVDGAARLDWLPAERDRGALQGR
jgi:hypothetical protein